MARWGSTSWRGHSFGADPVPVRRKVKSANAAVYAASMMATDEDPARTVGDEDPAFFLQPGADVDVLGTPKPNAHGVLYLPVTVPGKDGLFWVKSSAVAAAPAVVASKKLTVVPKPVVLETEEEPVALWKILLAVGAGVAVLGTAGYFLLRKRPAVVGRT